MRKLVLWLWIPCLCLMLSAPHSAELSTASDRKPPRGATTAQVDGLTETTRALQQEVKDLSAKLEASGHRIDDLQHAFVILGQQFSDLNTRVGDINNQNSIVSIWLTGFAIIFALLAFVGGIFTYVGAGTRAAKEAKAWMRESAQAYLDTVTPDLLGRFERNLRVKIEEELVPAAQVIIDRLRENAERHEAEMAARVTRAEEDARRLSAILTKSDDQLKNLTPDDRRTLKRADTDLRTKPESEYTPEDWRIRAFAAFDEKKFEDANFYFSKMEQAPGADKVDVVRALVGRGAAIGNLGRLEEAIVICNDVINRCGGDPDPALRIYLAAAIRNKGVCLEDLGRNEDAIISYNDVIARFGDNKTPTLEEEVAMTLVNKGFALGKLERSEEAIAAYEEVVARFGDNKEPALREEVAKALTNKGVILGLIGRNEDGIVAYDDVLARFGDDKESALREQVALALVNKGVRLGELGRGKEEIAVYDELLARFGNDREPALRQQAATALHYKGITLGELGYVDEEASVYREIIQRFSDATEAEVMEIVSKAKDALKDLL